MELGIILTVFNVTSGIVQTPMGWAVDRYGARTMLVFGLILGGAAYVSVGIYPSYWWMIASAVLLGIANGVYHPADYSILGSVIEPQRLGRAFSFHTFLFVEGEEPAGGPSRGRRWNVRCTPTAALLLALCLIGAGASAVATSEVSLIPTPAGWLLTLVTVSLGVSLAHVLAGAVLTGRFQRVRESVLLRTLGATRRQLRAIAEKARGG